MLCGIRAAGGMIGCVPCTLEWGHEGDMHANAGDGYYARGRNVAMHRRRQRIAASVRKNDRARATLAK